MDQVDEGSSGAGEELVEEVDADGGVVRVVARSTMRAEGLRHRCTYVVVQRPGDGALLVHRRAGWKDQWPGRWDLAFGGVCAVGEGWAESARRELLEEAGIEAPLEDLGAVGFDGEVHVLGRVFRTRHEGPFRFADGEVTAVEWVPLAELATWVASHEVCDDSAAVVPPLLGVELRE